VSGLRAGRSVHSGGRGELLAPYRLLAFRVIALAVRDISAYGQSAPERDSARAFLSGSPMLTHWCEIAGIDPASVRAQVGGFLEPTRPLTIPARRH
jgi:hypothetical protein